MARHRFLGVGQRAVQTEPIAEVDHAGRDRALQLREDLEGEHAQSILRVR